MRSQLITSLALSVIVASAAHIGRSEDALPAGAIARLGSARFGYDQQVYSLGISPDGERIVTVDVKGIHIWDTQRATEQLLIPVSFRGFSPRQICFSSDGRFVAAFVRNRFQMWSCADGSIVDSFERKEMLGWVAAVPNSELVAYSNGDSIHVRDFRKRVSTLDVDFGDHYVLCMAVSPDGRYLAVGARDRAVEVFELNAAGGLVARQLATDAFGAVVAMCFAKDNVLAVAAKANGEGSMLTIWEPHTYQKRASFAHEAAITAMTFGRASDRLITAAVDRQIRLWSLPDAEEVASLELDGTFCTVLHYSQNDRLISAHPDHVRFWDLKARAEQKPVRGHLSLINCVDVASDGQRAATGSSRDNTVRVWDLSTHSQLHRFVHRGVQAVTFGRNSGILAAVGKDSISIWDAAKGSLLHKIPRPGLARAAVLTIDRAALVCGTWSKNEVATISLETGQVLHEFTATKRCMDLHMSQDGQTLYFASESSIDEYSYPAGKLLKSIPLWGSEINCIDITTNRVAHAIKGDCVARRISQDWPPVRVFTSPDAITSISFDQSSTVVLAIGQSSGALTLLHVPSSETIAAYQQRGTLTAIAFAPSLRSVLSCSRNALIWPSKTRN